jgi:AraC-like DNA-binding protein
MLSKEFKELISKLNWTQTSLSPQLLSTFKGILTEVREPFANSTTMIHGLLTQALILLSRIAESEPSLIHSEPIQRVLDAVKRNPGHPWTSEELEKVAGLRHSQLHEIFRKEVGHSPRAYALGYRLREANRLLRESTLSITSLAHDLGFSSSQHLSSAFRKYFGITPSQCRQDKGF